MLVNHFSLATDEKSRQEILERANELMIRVKENSEEIYISKQAVFLEALCKMALNRSQEVVELLEDTARVPLVMENEILSGAYQALGQIEKSEEILQIGIYQNLVNMMDALSCYITLEGTMGAKKFDKAVEWIKKMDEVFDLIHLHPIIMVRCYLANAQGYMLKSRETKEPEKALALLERYASGIENLNEPVELHGDAYFDKIGGWLEELDLGCQVPSDFKSMRLALYKGVSENSLFDTLKEEERYKIIIKRLQNKLG